MESIVVGVAQLIVFGIGCYGIIKIFAVLDEFWYPKVINENGRPVRPFEANFWNWWQTTIAGCLMVFWMGLIYKIVIFIG